jgi:hypothetical protein
MIKFTDVSLLTFAKLRSHKVRTGLTVFVASLLFGVLIAASLITTGALRSIDAFRQDGLTGRYIVSVFGAPEDSTVTMRLLRDPVLIADAKKQYETLIEQKKAEAKRLGLEYNQASDQPPYSIGSDGKERLAINDPNGIIQKLLEDKFSGVAAFDDEKLRATAKQYGAIDLYSAKEYSIAQGSSLKVLEDGKEIFYDQNDMEATDANYRTPVISDTQMTLTPPEIIEPFLFEDNAGWRPSDGSIPVVLPQNSIEQLLGLKRLPKDASPGEKTDRLRVLKKEASSLAFRACYRNAASNELIQRTIQQQNEIRVSKSKKEYKSPSVIYALPNPTTCQNASIASDTRTESEKLQDANQELFDAMFATKQEPNSYFIPFKVVGVSSTIDSQNTPPGQEENAQSLDDILNDLLSTNGIGQAIPADLYSGLSDTDKHPELFTYTPRYLFGNEDNLLRYVEFSKASDAKKFIDEQSCKVDYDNTCKPAGRPYLATLSFSNSAAIDDLRTKAMQWFNYAMIGVIVMSAIVMSIAIGRAIADGRRETAIFRAIGFKRIDIAQVYVLYATILSLYVAVLALLIGFAGAYIVNEKYAPALTARAQYDFNDLAMSKSVDLIGLNKEQLTVIIIACLVTGLLAAILPLLRNLGRNPIRDMREE